MKKLTLLSIFSILLLSCSHNKKTDMKTKHFRFYTQYGQFYLTSDNRSFLDDGLNKEESVEDFNQSFKERLGIEKNGLIIFTASYGDIKGEIAVLDKPNINTNYDKYDHVVEAGINIESGELQILDCPNSHLELSLKVTPGSYRVRVYSSNLASVVGDDGDDFYRIELWKSDDMERKVLKQYEDN